MNNKVFDYWVASVQNGYIGNLAGIVEKAGGAKKLYEMSNSDMCERLGISRKLSLHISKSKEVASLEMIEDKMLDMEEKGIRFICNYEADFPKRLSEIASAPYGIFVRGSLPEQKRKSVAIIGARECSEYGRLMAEYFGSRLASKNINIISGMAWGIDGIAQRAALNSGGNSFAVLGCGVDVVYPRHNAGLYNELIENGNGVISEYVPGTRAEARLFPPRNRIISALCDVLLVVEARQKSGTLITVDMAIEQGRSVMIVPGRLTDPLSVGCLNLMNEGAVPVTGIESVLEELDIHMEKVAENDKRSSSEAGRKNPINCINAENYADILNNEERQIYDLLSLDPMGAESISKGLNKQISDVLATLTVMEAKGVIKESAPYRFVRCVKIGQ